MRRATLHSRPAGAHLARTIGRVPFTFGILALILTCALVSGAYRTAVLDSPLLGRVGYGWPALREGRVWTFATGPLFAPEPWMYLAITLVAIAFLGPYEYRMGTMRATTIVLATQIGGTFLSALLVGVTGSLGVCPLAAWSRTLDVGASAGIFGAGAALTALFAAPWQSRLRAILFAYLLIMLVVSTHYWDLEHLLAAGLGLVLGPAMTSRRRSDVPHGGELDE